MQKYTTLLIGCFLTFLGAVTAIAQGCNNLNDCQVPANCSNLTPSTLPRALYGGKIAIKPSSGNGIAANSILGDQTEEDKLLKYAQLIGTENLILNGMQLVLDNLSTTIPPSNTVTVKDALRDFIHKAKTQYDIKVISAIINDPDYIRKVEGQMPIYDWPYALSFYCNAFKTSGLVNIQEAREKLLDGSNQEMPETMLGSLLTVLQINNYNQDPMGVDSVTHDKFRSHSYSIDRFHLELEFWNKNQTTPQTRYQMYDVFKNIIYYVNCDSYTDRLDVYLDPKLDGIFDNCPASDCPTIPTTKQIVDQVDNGAAAIYLVDYKCKYCSLFVPSSISPNVFYDRLLDFGHNGKINTRIYPIFKAWTNPSNGITNDNLQNFLTPSLTAPVPSTSGYGGNLDCAENFFENEYNSHTFPAGTNPSHVYDNDLSGYAWYRYEDMFANNVQRKAQMKPTPEETVWQAAEVIDLKGRILSRHRGQITIESVSELQRGLTPGIYLVRLTGSAGSTIVRKMPVW